mmetsp:Transcript_70916/g.122919  ORF Transcript_70916/g.122919 Transcript_70916/m.122919 type:complete len:572 (+) Transcript_70916:175-1890(+)
MEDLSKNASRRRSSMPRSSISMKSIMEEAEARERDQVEQACRALFNSYDVDESGELDAGEFLALEMRLSYARGEEVRADSLSSRLTLTDKDRSGQLSYEEFRDATLRKFSEERLPRPECIRIMGDWTKAALLERTRMGPRYHAGIRQALKRIFCLYDVSGDGSLDPEEWIAAQKTVAMEISDDIDPAWIDEAAFRTADTNGDGVLSQGEFLEASFSMFEVTRLTMSQLLSTLQGVVSALERRKSVETTAKVTLWLQSKAKPDFQPPNLAVMDEEKDADKARESTKYRQAGEIALPTNLRTLAEVEALLRLTLDIPTDTWLSIYFVGPDPEGSLKPVMLLRDSIVQETLEYLTKPSALNRLYIKNVRKAPKRLARVRSVYMEERETLLAKQTGNCWGIDWETQLVGEGKTNPTSPFVVFVGDAVIIEVPTTAEGGQYTYVVSVFMDGDLVLSRPVEAVIEPKQPKKKKKKKGATPEPDVVPDPLIQLSLVALSEGKCVFFVDVSWEDQEGKLVATHGLTTPVHENSIARIGPMEVTVEKAPPGAPRADKTLQWWNGDKWSNKKGPAKKKGKK